MDRAINRVAPGSAYPAQAVPKANQRRESDKAKQFENELDRNPDETEPADTNENEEHETKPTLHISPLAEGDPGNLLDLTA